MSKVLMPMPTAGSICARPSTGDKPFPRVCAGEPMPPIEPQPRTTRHTDNPDPPNRRRSTARQRKRPLGPLGTVDLRGGLSVQPCAYECVFACGDDRPSEVQTDASCPSAWSCVSDCDAGTIRVVAKGDQAEPSRFRFRGATTALLRSR